MRDNLKRYYIINFRFTRKTLAPRVKKSILKIYTAVKSKTSIQQKKANG